MAILGKSYPKTESSPGASSYLPTLNAIENPQNFVQWECLKDCMLELYCHDKVRDKNADLSKELFAIKVVGKGLEQIVKKNPLAKFAVKLTSKTVIYTIEKFLQVYLKEMNRTFSAIRILQLFQDIAPPACIYNTPVKIQTLPRPPPPKPRTCKNGQVPVSTCTFASCQSCRNGIATISCVYDKLVCIKTGCC
jgi:hypothetical protein